MFWFLGTPYFVTKSLPLCFWYSFTIHRKFYDTSCAWEDSVNFFSSPQGGSISLSKREPLVNGVLPFTRGLGSHGDPALKACVIPTPYTAAVSLDERCQALIIATPGLWKVRAFISQIFIILRKYTCTSIMSATSVFAKYMHVFETEG